MGQNLKRNLLVGLALVAVIAGGLIAVLSSGGGHPRPKRPAAARRATEVQLAAEYLDLTPAELRHRLRDGATILQIAKRTPGKSVTGLLDAMTAARAAGLRREGGTAAGEPAALKALHARALLVATRRRRRSVVSVSASYLGISEASLLSRLRSSGTLARIAGTIPGRSSTGLIEALTTARRSYLRLARAAGTISSAEEESALSTLPARVEREVHAKILGG